MKIEETVKRLQDIYLTALGVLSNGAFCWCTRSIDCVLESQAIAGGSAEIDPKVFMIYKIKKWFLSFFAT